METLSKEELVQRNTVLQMELKFALKEIYRLRDKKITAEQLNFILSENVNELQSTLFGSSSERYKKTEKEKTPKIPKPRVKKPSERYPNIPVREEVISMANPPNCEVCGDTMVDSGLTEESEQLTVIPKKFEIIKNIRTKYRCRCQSCLVTAPLPPRIIPGSTYSDEMIQDVVLSKYCDLIPIERYVQMARRGGLINLPPHSLIELTHSFADFVSGVYTLIKSDIMSSRVLHADETPHKMLEGSNNKSWYLWGFSTPTACFLECRNTRSGDVASEILMDSQCEILLTDVFSGYNKAIKEANVHRKSKNKNLIENANCNAHARRYFFKIKDGYKETEFYLDLYHEIYKLNSESKGKTHSEILALRSQMRPMFEAMKVRADAELPRYPNKNKYQKALNYFIENYEGLTLFLDDPEVAIDNNPQERLLRSHVVGRKTWYGTHSERGAFTAAVLFSIVETCKLNGVNPREYFSTLVADLLQGGKGFTPFEYKSNLATNEIKS
ncbi:MAG: IS66 family transposase [Bdellovibrio sp.]